MFKATLPTATLAGKSPRAKYLSPRPPRVPPPQNGRKRSQQLSSRDPQSTNTTQKTDLFSESFGLSTGGQAAQPLPKFEEDPEPPITGNRLYFQRTLDQLFCESELHAILDYALSTVDVTDNRSLKKLRTQFENRDLIPRQLKSSYKPPKDGFQTALTAEHTLEVQSYLHFKSDSLHKDLSIVFGSPLTESHVTDPNPIFDSFLQQLQTETETFLMPFEPYKKITFPFIVCIGGPVGSGRTTVCQFFQKAFDCHVIDVRKAYVDPNLKKSKTMSQEIDSSFEPPPEFPLKDSIQVRFQDEKLAATMIADAMKENMDGRGFVIDGFPNNKNQQTALEKAMGAANVSLRETRNPSVRAARSSKSARSSSKSTRASATCIDGIIITTLNDGNDTRMIDPITGNIYKIGFHVPCLTDMIGVCPLSFESTVKEIQGRLEEICVDAPVLPPKTLQQYKSYSSALEKSINSIIVSECESSTQLLEILDTFVNNLYSKNTELLPNDKPMISLLKPTCIIRPEICFSAVTTWYRCLEEFGRPMADQSNLISTFSNKVELLSKAAIERYQLLISQKDDRIALCEEFMKNQSTMNLSAHFRKIWDLSIMIRNSNLELVDQIIDRCGLIELLLELRKGTKIVFIALVHRLLNIMWFFDTFEKIPKMEINDRTRCSFFNDLVVPKTEIPKYNFMCAVKPAPLKAFRSMYQITKIIPDKMKNQPVMASNVFNSPPPKNNRASSDRQRPMTSRAPKEVQKEKQNESQKKERKYLAGIRGYDYLLENLQSLKERPEDKIFFNSDGACNALGIIHLEAKSSFEKQPVKYAEEFFSHVEKLLDSKMVAQEARISLKLFRRFTTNCKRKEAAMVNSVFDLRDLLTSYAYNKCTHEMESFARRFRYLKQGGQLEGPLFRYDMSKINEDVKHLADLSVLMDPPIYSQDLISIPILLEVAQKIVNKGQKFSSATEFLESASECKISNFELLKLELALRVIECVECFDTQKFLLSFIRTKEDELKIKDIFKRPPQNIEPEEPQIFPRRPEHNERARSHLSDFSYYSLEEEEEESAFDEEEEAY